MGRSSGSRSFDARSLPVVFCQPYCANAHNAPIRYTRARSQRHPRCSLTHRNPISIR